MEPEKGKVNLLRFRESWSFLDMILHCRDPDEHSATVPGFNNEPCVRDRRCCYCLLIWTSFNPPRDNFSAPCCFSTPPFDAQYSQY